MLKFNWSSFSDEFYAHLSKIIEDGLNLGPRPHGVCAPLLVKDLYFGKEPPSVSILEIAELTLHRTRILLRISYASDGYIVINTQVQANPLCGAQGTSFNDWRASTHNVDAPPQLILAADKSLVVPMVIRLTDLHLDGLLWVTWLASPANVSVAFVSDPLVGVNVSTTFDSVAKVKEALQAEIEGQIREALLKTIPNAISAMDFKCGFDP